MAKKARKPRPLKLRNGGQCRPLLWGTIGKRRVEVGYVVVDANEAEALAAWLVKAAAWCREGEKP